MICPGIPSTTVFITSTSAACVRARFHSSRGLSAMNISVASIAPASVATSGVPVRLQTWAISAGNSSRSAFSIRMFIRHDSSMLVPGARMMPSTMSPSESLGTNSVPSEAARSTVMPRITQAIKASVPRAARQARRAGRYSHRINRTRSTSCESIRFGRKKLESTGTTVSESTSDPIRMNTTVRAIGRNIFPSTPSSVRIGM